MATQLFLKSGSIFNGNPITLGVRSNYIAGVSMHRIIFEVKCGITDGKYEIIKLASSVITPGTLQDIDISSALRTFRDSYNYTPEAGTFPIVKFNVKAYDEYMLNGELYTNIDPVFYPKDPETLPEEQREEAYLRTIFGGYSDMQRILAGPTKSVQTLTRKPTTIPQLVVNGETFTYAPPFSTEQRLEQSYNLTQPQSKTTTVSREGAQTIGYQSIYALPSAVAKDRQTFRFINSFGVLESISVQRATQKKLPFTIDDYTKATQETFNDMSHAIVKKTPSPQTWMFCTDPLDDLWLEWYLDEFLMAENVWMLYRGKWLRVHIIPEDEYVFQDKEKNDVLAVRFSARLDINGSPIL